MKTAVEPRSNTKRKILDLTQNLLLEKGYNGFSYKHISTQLGIKNAAVHYYFPTKEDLGVAIIQRVRRRFQKWIHRSSIQEMNAWGKLDWFFSIYETYSAGGNRTCFLANLEAEFDTIPPFLQEEARALNAELLDWLSHLVRSGRQQGAFIFEGTPENKAIIILASIQGALQIARVTTYDSFKTSLQQIKSDLGYRP